MLYDAFKLRHSAMTGGLLVAQFAASLAAGQTVSGRTLDAETLEPIPYAVVSAMVEDRIASSTISDSSGTFTLRVPVSGNFTLRAARAGYATTDRAGIREGADLQLPFDIPMSSAAIELDPVVARTALGRLNPAATLAGVIARHSALPRVGSRRVIVRSDPELQSVGTVGTLLDYYIAGSGRRCTDWFLNGFVLNPLSDPEEFIRTMSTGIVAAVEFYAEDITAPLDFQGKGYCRNTSGGFYSIVAVWTGG